MTIRISGMASGLDTESIIDALVSAYSYKKDKYVKAQTKLSWTQDAWKTLNSKVYSLYSSISSMRYSSNYSLKKATCSDSTKASVTASSSTINGTHSLKITKLASAGYITGGKLADDITADSTLVNAGYSTSGSGTIDVKVGDKTTSISVSKNAKISDFIDQLASAGLSANFDSSTKRIFVSSSSSGATNDFSITAGDAGGLEALSCLGLVSEDELKGYTTDASKFAKDASGNSLNTDGAGSYDVDATSTYLSEKIANIRAAYVNLDLLNSDNDSLKAAATQTAAEAQAVLDDEENAALIKYIGMDSSEWLASTADEISNKTLLKIDTAMKAGSTSVDNSSSSYAEMAKTYASISTNGVGMISYDSDATKSEIEEAVLTIHEAYVKASEAGDTSGVYDSLDETSQKWWNFVNENYGADYDWVQADTTSLSEKIYNKVDLAAKIYSNQVDLTDDPRATRVEGSDAEIYLDGAKFTSSTNSVTVNGMTVECTGLTGDNDLQITVATDTSGLYDKVKEFLSQYNSLINEMMELYNADSASDYEPLTDDEKSEMSDTEIEKWEQKIKDSLLRRDTNLSSLINTMTGAMMQTYTINGQTYSWSSFGISTLGYLNAEKNENYAYHIDGDSEDSATSGNSDKLLAALAEDPDTVIEFMKQMTSGLYTALDAKMKSTTVSSVYTVYNDKEMASEYSDYTDLIKQWTTRISDMEDSYYKKFAAMESALATLQSNSSSISSLLG